MIEPLSMSLEFVSARNDLRLTAERTRGKFDERMRANVKELLGYRYADIGKPIELPSETRELMEHIENADILSDVLFGANNSERRQWKRANLEWYRNRPVRVYNYVQKIADIFHPEHLTHLLRTSLRMTPEALISFYEANPNEAKLSDYAGQPSAIDPNVFKNHD